MNKFLISLTLIIVSLCFLNANNALAATTKKAATPADSSTMYFMPDTNTWSSVATAQNAIKIVRKGSKYYNGKNIAFEIQTDVTILKNNTFAAVNNTNLKFYTAEYKDGKFSPVEMKAKEVQPLFDNVKVVAVSEFKNGVTTIRRPPYTKQPFLLLNDTNMDFAGYRFLPNYVQRSDIKGQFIATKVGTIRFLKDGDVYKKYPVLRIWVRIDQEKYNQPQNIRINYYQK